jgi:hypothetical protein
MVHSFILSRKQDWFQSAGFRTDRYNHRVICSLLDRQTLAASSIRQVKLKHFGIANFIFVGTGFIEGSRLDQTVYRCSRQLHPAIATELKLYIPATTFIPGFDNMLARKILFDGPTSPAGQRKWMRMHTTIISLKVSHTRI